MASFEKRINDNINSGIASPIWANEKGTFWKIREMFRKREHKSINGVNCDMPERNSYHRTKSWISYEMVSITMSEFNDEIVYSVYADELGGEVILAIVASDKVEFPQYEPERRVTKDINGKQRIGGLVKNGELPLSEVKPTVIETIEKTVREHPIMGRYADMILGDFNNILSLDPERKIEPISEEAKSIAVLQEKNNVLQEDNQRKDIQIGRLQRMLNKTLEFARNVRDSIVGKIFFKNQIAQLDIPEGELPESQVDKGER